MKSITNYTYYLLAFFLAFGSVNPFKLGSVSDQITDQQGLSPILFIVCILLSLINKESYQRITAKRNFYFPLLLMTTIIFISSVIWDVSTIPNHLDFFIKLMIGIVGFVTISSYFELYPKALKVSLLIYAYTSVTILLLFFIGRLDAFSYYSNGRLWIFGINPNTFSFMMGLGALYLANDLFSKERKGIIKLINIVSILIVFLYILLSGSRGTLLFIVVSMFILLLPYMGKKWFLIIPVVFVVFFISSRFLQSNTNDITIVERMQTIGQEDDREELIYNALSLFTDSPLYGLGRNGYVEQRLERFHDPRDSHNILLSIMVMGGILALICYLVFLKRMYAYVKTNRDRLALCLFVYVLLMSLKTGDVITFMLMWYVFAIAISCKKFESYITC